MTGQYSVSEQLNEEGVVPGAGRRYESPKLIPLGNARQILADSSGPYFDVQVDDQAKNTP